MNKTALLKSLGLFLFGMSVSLAVFADQPGSAVAAKSEPIVKSPAPAATAQTAPAAKPDIVWDTQSVKDKVKELRASRERQMPYLNKATLNDKINSRKVRSRLEFATGGEKDLEDVLQRAVSVYTPAIADRERIVLAKRKILAALRALFPGVDFDFDIKKGTLSGEPYNSRDYKFSVNQTIFNGGILWNTMLQEKAGLETAQKEYIATVEDLVSEVSAAYFEYNRASQIVELQNQALASMKKYVDDSKEKYKSQLISEIESLNVESMYSLTQYDHETSKQELELAKLDLQRYLDLDITDDLKIESPYDLEKLNKASENSKDADNVLPDDAEGKAGDTSLSDLVDLAYQHRANLQVDSAKLDSARLQEKIRMGEFMPKVDLTIDFGRLGEAFTSVTDSPDLQDNFRCLLEFSWNIGGNKATWDFENDEKAPSVTQFQQGVGSQTTRHSMHFGLLDGLSDWASVKEAEVAKLDQLVQLEKTEKEVIRDVKQSYFDYQKAKIRVKSSLQRYNYRKRLSAYSKFRLEKNEIQISEYLQTEIDVLSEATSLHKALTDYYTAKAKLNHAIGIRNYFPLKEIHGNTAKS